MVVTGRLALIALLGVPVVGARPQASTWWAVLAVLGLLVTIDVALAGSVRGLRFSRTGATDVRLGTTARIDLRVVNPGGRTVRGVLRDAWSPSAGAAPSRHTLAVRGGDAVIVTTRLTPSRRGDHRPDRVTVRSLGPLGLAGRQGAHQVPWRLRALPPFESRKHLPSRLQRLSELEGRTPVMVRGAGTEFDTLRPYVIGDDVRSIDWRATARSNDVVVRTWRPERDRRVVIVLDTGRTAAARVGDAPRLDSAMDAALLLAALAGRAGDHVALLAHDARSRAWVEGAEGADLLPTLVRTMATLDAELVETDLRAIVGQVLAKRRQRALVVLITAIEPAVVRDGLLKALPTLVAKHQVVVASISDPRASALRVDRDGVDAIYAAASAEAADRERRAVSDFLRTQGVEVVEADPEHIAPALADRYLALKAAGRL
jgi:uncharacterized protein (DUF58 family)